MEEKRIACIGGFELFKALGLEVYKADNSKEALKTLKEVRKSFDLIILAERFAEELDLTELREDKVPLIIELPDEQGETGIGRRRIAELISKASGIELKVE